VKTIDQSVKHRQITIRNPEHRAAVGLFVLAILYTLYLARLFLMPLAFALVLSILLRPVVRRLNRLKIPEAVSAGVVVLTLLLGIGAGLYNLSTPAAKWLDRGPYLLKTLEFKMSEFKASLDKARETTRQLEDMADLGEAQQEIQINQSSLAEKIFSRVQTFSSTAVIILVLVYFMLAYGWRILQRLSEIDPDSGRSNQIFRLVIDIQDDLSSYLLTVAAINVCLGALTALAMALLGLPNPVLWGVAAAMFNFVPYLGAAATLVIISVVSTLTFDLWPRILCPPTVFLFFTALEGQFVTPSILGRRLRLNPLVVLVAILFWGWIWGIAGAILGVPLLTAFMVAARKIKVLQPIERAMTAWKHQPPTGEETQMSEDDFLTHLRQDHEQQIELGRQLCQAGTSEERARLRQEFYDALHPHMIGEEASIFPRLKDGDDDAIDDSLEGLQEHHVAKMVLRELMDLETNSEVFKPKAKVLDELNRHHIEEEEQKIFEHLKRMCSQQELDDLFEKYEAAEEGAKS
jgi:predicted PurR-regulated permease PerM